ncbi:MAG: 50S ribosomal protein L25 [Patescibacteria group bacterium]
MALSLNVKTRESIGKRVKDVRNTGDLPGVVYGQEIEPKHIALALRDFSKISKKLGSSSLLDLTIDSEEPVKALVQEVQVHPVTMVPIHIDLRQIKMGEKLTVDVPLSFVGEAPAVKELSGTLMRAYDSLSIKCLPRHLPSEIEVDLSKLKTFDDDITIADLGLSQDLEVQNDLDSVLASVTPPLTEDQLKKMEEGTTADVDSVKVEGEEEKVEEGEEKKGEVTEEKKEEEKK